MLLDLKRQGKTFGEIATTLTTRNESEVEARYKEIGLPVSTQEGNPVPAAAAAEPAKTAGEKGGKGQQKGKQGNEGKQKGKGKASAAKAKNQPAVDAVADDLPSDPFTDAAGAAAAEANKKGEAVVASKVDMKVKGILKRGGLGEHPGHTTVPAGVTSVMGRPIIFMEEHDPLDVDEVCCVPLSLDLMMLTGG